MKNTKTFRAWLRDAVAADGISLSGSANDLTRECAAVLGECEGLSKDDVNVPDIDVPSLS